MTSNQDSSHVPISQLWAYSRDPNVPESIRLGHLSACDDCMDILWVCRSSESVQQVKDRLEKHGITADC